MATVKVAPVPSITPDAPSIERMWISKVSPRECTVAIPVPTDIASAAGIFAGGKFVAIRALGSCVVICPVDSVAPGEIRKEVDRTFMDAIESWVRRGNLQNTVLGRAVMQRPKK